MSFIHILECVKINNKRMEDEISELDQTLRGLVGHMKADRPTPSDTMATPPVPVANHYLEDLERETYRTESLVSKLQELHRHLRERIHGNEATAGMSQARLAS